MKLLTKIPRHSELLSISKDSREIEDQLNAKLAVLTRFIGKLEKQDQFNEFLDNDYREKATTSIRQAVEKIYQIAAAYVADFTKREYYTTVSDINAIERLSIDYSQLFFSRLSRFVININKEEKPIGADVIVRLTTANMTQQVLHQAIIGKSQRMLNQVTITTAAEGDNQIIYVWLTSQDDKVCPICSGYEGQTWSFDDYNSIPDIPDDTHPNCRCIIQLSEAIE